MQSLAERLEEIVRVEERGEFRTLWVGGIKLPGVLTPSGAEMQADEFRAALAPLLPRWVLAKDEDPPVPDWYPVLEAVNASPEWDFWYGDERGWLRGPWKWMKGCALWEASDEHKAPPPHVERPRWVDDPEKEPPEEGVVILGQWGDDEFTLAYRADGEWWEHVGGLRINNPPVRYLLGVPMP